MLRDPRAIMCSLAGSLTWATCKPHQRPTMPQCNCCLADADLIYMKVVTPLGRRGGSPKLPFSRSLDDVVKLPGLSNSCDDVVGDKILMNGPGITIPISIAVGNENPILGQVWKQCAQTR